MWTFVSLYVNKRFHFSLPHLLHKLALWMAVAQLKSSELSRMSVSSGSNYQGPKVPLATAKTRQMETMSTQKKLSKKRALIFAMWAKKHFPLWPKWMDINEINYPLWELSKKVYNLIFSYLVTYGAAKRWGFLSVLISQSALIWNGTHRQKTFRCFFSLFSQTNYFQLSVRQAKAAIELENAQGSRLIDLFVSYCSSNFFKATVCCNFHSVLQRFTKRHIE